MSRQIYQDVIVASIYSCMLFLTYFRYRKSVLVISENGLNDAPGDLFVVAASYCIFWTVLSFGLFFVFSCIWSSVLWSASEILLLPPAIVGLVGWIVLLIRSLKKNDDYEASIRAFPSPPFHIQLTDLLGGAFVFGCTLLAFRAITDMRWSAAANAISMAYLLIAQLIAFMIAMDGCRRVKDSSYLARRFVWITGMQATSAIPGMILILIVSWQVWRYALWKSRVPALPAPF